MMIKWMALLLLFPKKKNNGDFNINKSNRIVIEKQYNPRYIFTGIQILKSKVFLKIKRKKISFILNLRPIN